MQIATKKHIEGIYQMLKACGQHLREIGIDQWVTEYPDLDTIKKDVAAAQAYVLEEAGRVVGSITLNEEQDPQYQQVAWKYPAERVLVVHRLGVHPEIQGKGHAHQLMQFAEDLGRKKGCQVIRLDAYSANPRSQAFYLRRGYEQNGQVHFSYQSKPCNCFELSLNNV